MKKLAIAILIVMMWAGVSWGTNIYVRPSGSDTNCNGTANIDDSEPVRPACAYATLTKGVSASVANGDTITLLGGAVGGSEVTYVEAAAVVPARSSLTINCSIDYGCIVQNNAAGNTRVIHIAAGATGITIGKIVIDGNNDDVSCVTFDSSNAVANAVFNGTKFLNPTGSFLTTARSQNLTLSNNWVATAVSLSSNGFGFISNQSGTFTLSDGTITISEATNNTAGISDTPTADNHNLTINNVTISVTTTNSKSVTGIATDGVTSVNLYSNTISLSTNSGVAKGIGVDLNSSYNADTVNIYTNNINLVGTSGYGILVGADGATAPADRDTITTPLVYSNTITGDGNEHGILLGWITGGKVYKNNVSTTNLGIATKGTTNCLVYYNLCSTFGTSGCLRGKIASGTVFSNNTCATDVGSSYAFYATDTSTGLIYKNNIAYSSQAASLFVNIEALSSATLSHNGYHSTTASITGAWAYGANSYDTFATWQGAGHGSFGFYADPVFVDTTDFELDTGSPAKNTGWCGSRGISMTDYDGTTIVGRPDIGAQESSTLGAMCGQKNLNLLWMGK